MSMKIYQGYEYEPENKEKNVINLIGDLTRIKEKFIELLVEEMLKFIDNLNYKFKPKDLKEVMMLIEKEEYKLNDLSRFEIELLLKSIKNKKEIENSFDYMFKHLLDGHIAFYPYSDKKEDRERYILYFHTSLYELLEFLGDDFKNFHYQNSCSPTEEEKPEGWDRRKDIWNDLLGDNNYFDFPLADEEGIRKIAHKIYNKKGE